MKKKVFGLFSLLPLLFLTGCFDNKPYILPEEPLEGPYVDRQVNIYRRKNVVDKTLSLRFYAETRNIPYISVFEYFKEFYNTELNVSVEDHQYKYLRPSGAYLLFDIEKQEFASNSLYSFNTHPDFIESNGKLFIKSLPSEATIPKVRTIKLSDYEITIHEDNSQAYVPLSLLSSLIGGIASYDISYNGQDVYVLDYGGQLGVATSPNYFGQSYFAPLNKLDEPRPVDVINYTYQEHCLVFDNLRGETEQLFLGEENLNELGLDGVLTRDYPKTKEYLLSSKKEDYYEGYQMLMIELSDGGHTGIPGNTKFSKLENAIKGSEEEFVNLYDDYYYLQYLSQGMYTTFYMCKYEMLGVYGNYYKYDATSKTAYIGIDSFEVDYEGWDEFYRGIGDVPVNSDTYAYVRSKMYEAKDDGAEYLILDLTTNLGGDSYALEGVVSLFNNAKGYITMKNTFNDYIVKENHAIDINLDGQWDELDEAELSLFNFKVGVLTSPVAFSCGNLFPYQMKELGYKIIGEKSGGGSCAISYETTADGIGYVHSSYLTLVDQNGVNIDGGVDVDYKIEMEPTEFPAYYYVYDYYDFALTSSILNQLYA